MENKNEKPTVTRAEKTDAAKKLIRALLEKSDLKSNDLIDEAAELYARQFESEDAPNSVKGRIGSVIDVMKKEGEITFEGGMYALKKEEKSEKPKKTPKGNRKKTETPVEENVPVEGAAEETPKKKRTAKPKQTAAETNAEEQAQSKPKTATKNTRGKKKNEPLPAAPLQPIAPVAPVTPEVAPEPIPEEKGEEKPKKRGRKAKAEKSETPIKTESAQTNAVEEKTTDEAKGTPMPVAEKTVVEAVETPVEEKWETPAKEEPKKSEPTLVDMSFLLGGKTVKKELPKREEPKRIAPKAESLAQPPKAEEKPNDKPSESANENAAEKPQGRRSAQPQKPQPKTLRKERITVKKPSRALTADEKLKEAFLKRLHKLGGDYFEYYSVYLLEKYSRMNGRRLEGLKISGGERDGGIDGEIELTDRLGFRETIYIQAKNWDPDKGDERLWVVGETLLQQFIGACVCRQAKDGKQHCRGIFITTSRFTAEAKKILDDTSDKFVGYDGTDLYEAAKECAFGLVKKNGEWALDEELLSGEKAFFAMR